ncbi:hypothetical protein ABEV40_18340, partial [Geobacillus thermocatenulatus]
MYSEPVFLDKIVKYLDNKFFEKKANAYEGIFDLKVVHHFKNEYLNSEGLIKEKNKGLYYFAFEEYVDQKVRPFDDSIKNSLELKRFPVSDKEILSLKELEAILPSSKVNHKERVAKR